MRYRAVVAARARPPFVADNSRTATLLVLCAVRDITTAPPMRYRALVAARAPTPSLCWGAESRAGAGGRSRGRGGDTKCDTNFFIKFCLLMLLIVLVVVLLLLVLMLATMRRNCCVSRYMWREFKTKKFRILIFG